MHVKTEKVRLFLGLLNTTDKTSLMNGKRLVRLRTSKAHQGCFCAERAEGPLQPTAVDLHTPISTSGQKQDDRSMY